MPAISVPMGWIPRESAEEGKKLPVGIHFTAPHQAEDVLFAVSLAVEKAHRIAFFVYTGTDARTTDKRRVFFRLLYEWIYGPHAVFNYAGFQAAVAHIWLWIIVIGYLLSIIGLFVIVYATVRLFELRKREESCTTARS